MLEQVDLSSELSKQTYREVMPELRSRLYSLQMACRKAQIPTVIVFEGWAGAGKGIAIQSLTRRLDPRFYKLYPIEPPRSSELEMPWLWRFWLKLPRYGEIAVFYRSWYRRLISERIEGVVSTDLWERRCLDIEHFEQALADDGTVLIKFFLHVSKKEQAKRLKKLENDPLTHWRARPDDKKQNRKYDEYITAIEETLARTETERGPWTIVEATDARWAKHKIFETVAHRLEEGLKQRGADLSEVTVVAESSPQPAASG